MNLYMVTVIRINFLKWRNKLIKIITNFKKDNNQLIKNNLLLKIKHKKFKIKVKYYNKKRMK
jgi:hypothetical protein